MKKEEAASPAPGPIVILCHYFWPEEMATAEMVSGVAFELSKQGLPIAAIAGQPAYRNRGAFLPRTTSQHGVVIRRVWSTRFNKNNPAGRILNTATFAVSAFLAALFFPNPGGYLAVTNPPLLPWVAALVGFLRRRPCYLLIHDVYPEIAIALDKIPPGSAVARFWGWLNRQCYRRADRIIVLGSCMARAIHPYLRESERGKTVIIQNWADGERIQPVPSGENPLLQELGLEDKFVVSYSGNIGLFHEIETIAKAAKALENRADIHFLFIGDGAQHVWLKNFLEEEKLANATLLPFQPKDRLPTTLTACDAGLVSLKDEATGYCVPSKFYGMLAAGKAIIAIANEASEVAEAVQRHGCGMVIPPGNAGLLRQAIESLAKDKTRAQKMGSKARIAFRQNYSLAKTVAKYIETLRFKSEIPCEEGGNSPEIQDKDSRASQIRP